MKNFKVAVSPEIQIYKTLQRIGYSIKSAFGEFIDNSIQSFIDHKSIIQKTDGRDARLHITIAISSHKHTITITDNANGISRSRFHAAMKAGGANQNAHAPSSLSVYGIGMKTAAIWMSNKWSIKTSTIGSTEKLTTTFDLDKLIRGDVEKIDVNSTNEKANKHYTTITLTKLLRVERKEFYQEDVLPWLKETYMKFPSLDIEITYDDEPLLTEKGSVATPEPLEYPVVDSEGNPISSKKVTWERNINVTYSEDKHKVTGFIMIRGTGSYGQPGIRLFRNNRLIVGTSLEPNTPKLILGTSNKYANQRIYGELHLNTVPVNFMKTGFDINLNGLYVRIKHALEQGNNFVGQATNYRVRKNKQNLGKHRGRSAPNKKNYEKKDSKAI